MRTKILTARLLTASAMAGLVSFSGAAFAQDASAQGDSASVANGVGEIIVTAQKREQSIQDVPVAVTALGQAALQANRVESVKDLTGLAPGLITRNNPGSSGSPSYSMRGVFASSSVPSQDREIATYVDGVYIGANRASVFNLPDLQRIEVLRGPQGTLFGRNATAGAISIVTRDPSGEFSVQQDVSVGNEAYFRTRTSIETPKFGPFSALVTFVHDENHGDTRNTGYGTTFDRTSPYLNIGKTYSPKWLGGQNEESIFAALKFDNGGPITATYKFDWLQNTNVPELRTVTVVNPNDFVGGMLLSVYNSQPAGGGQYGPTTINSSNQRPDAYNNAWSQEGWQKGQGHNLTINLQASDNLTFKNIAAYRKAKVYAPATVAGLDGMELTPAALGAYAQFAGISYLSGLGVNVADPANAATVAATIGSIATKYAPAVGSYFSTYGGSNYGRSWQFSDELQANYSSDFVTVTAGALYYEGYELSSGIPGFQPNVSFSPVIDQFGTQNALALGNVQTLTNKTISLAAYAQAEFKVTPALSLVLGGRITKDKKTGGVERGGSYVGTDRTNGSIVGTSFDGYTFKKTKPTYSIGVNYKPTRDILAYAKYSTAFLSGGAVTNAFPFAPETVKSAEAGIKTELFDHKVRFNLTGWWAKYHNLQAANSGTCCGHPELSVIVLQNGDLNAKGIEAELNIAPVTGLSFGGSVGYTHVHQTNFDPILAQGRPIAPTNTPKFAGTANVTYITPPVFEDATLMFRLDTTFQTKMRMYPYTDIATKNPSFLPYEFIKGRAIFNGRIALQDIDMRGGAKMEIAAWGKNIFNNRDSLYAFNFADILVTSSYQPARTYGLDVSIKFKP